MSQAPERSTGNQTLVWLRLYNLMILRVQFVDQRLTKQGLDRQTISGLLVRRLVVPVSSAMRPKPGAQRSIHNLKGAFDSIINST